MRKINNLISLLTITLLLTASGCARWLPSGSDISTWSTRYNPWSLIGINTKDLRQSYAFKKKQTFDIPYETAFDKVMLILKQNTLVVYESDKWGKYIIAIGFKKQVDTTRVGIFFKPLGKDKTEITISSLSNTTVQKAAPIVFRGLELQ